MKTLSPDKKTLIQWAVVGLLLFVAYLLYLFLGDNLFTANFLVYICLFVIAGQGWNLLGGYIGEISFGHAVFFGIGAYAVGLPVGYKMVDLQKNVPLQLYALVLVGAVVAALFALLISYPLLRVRGFPFLIGTFGLGIVFHSVVVATPALFATKGIFIPHVDSNVLFPIIVAVTILTAIFIQWLVHQNLGLRFRAVRDVPEAAEMVGINLYRTKATALVIGAFLTALAGGFFALYSSFVNPEAGFSTNTSTSILLGPYLGGVGTVLGPVVGGFLVIMIQEFSRSTIPVNGGHYLVLGVLLIVIMMTSKEGIYPGLKRLALKLVGKLRNAKDKPQNTV